MKKIAVIGHVLQDNIHFVREFPSKGTKAIITRPPHVGIGGSAANFAINCAKLGHAPTLFSAVGKDRLGAELIGMLKENSVGTDGIRIEKNKSTSYALILEDSHGEHLASHELGALSANVRITREELEGHQWLHMAGCSMEWLEQASKIAEKLEISVSFNPGKSAAGHGKDALGKIINRARVLFLNLREATGLIGTGMELAEFARKTLVDVIVTDGVRQTMVYSHGGAVLAIHPEKTDSVASTLGAGDAFAAGVVSALLDENRMRQAIEIGHLQAARKIGHLDATKM